MVLVKVDGIKAGINAATNRASPVNQASMLSNTNVGIRSLGKMVTSQAASLN